jgi:hypothetical protein
VAFVHRDLKNPAPSDIFLRGFNEKMVYLNKPKSFEKVKHNIEQTVASGDAGSLRKVAR